MDYREVQAFRADVEAAIHEAIEDLEGALLSWIEAVKRRVDEIETARRRSPAATPEAGPR